MAYFLGKVFRAFLVIYVGVFSFLLVRPAPLELDESPVAIPINAQMVSFLADTTYQGESGAVRVEENIFPRILEVLKGAHSFIYADMFLFNEFHGKDSTVFRDQTNVLRSALVGKKSLSSSTQVIFLTDPINQGYGGVKNIDLDEMEQGGVLVYETPLEKLRDSNLLWSTIYRMLFQWFGNSTQYGWLPNPLDTEGEKVTLRTYASLLNFKANHRKILVVDTLSKGKKSYTTIIGSLNPHTASSYNWNTALEIRSTEFGEAVLSSERALFHFAGLPPFSSPSSTPDTVTPVSGTATYVTQKHIEKAVIETINNLREHTDRLDIAMFYLSDKTVIQAIERAVARGVQVRILLDPNATAFGKNKYGIPNRQTVERLLSKNTSNLSIKWCNTHGEQCHGKLLIAAKEGGLTLIVGSANYTRRNLNGYNLESAVKIDSAVPMKPIADASAYFDRLWNNTKGETSVSVEVYRDRASWKSVLAWVMETTGLSTF